MAPVSPANVSGTSPGRDGRSAARTAAPVGRRGRCRRVAARTVRPQATTSERARSLVPRRRAGWKTPSAPRVDLAHVEAGFDPHPRVGALGGEQGDDLARDSVAKKLAELFFVVRDAVALDQGDKILRPVARQRRTAEIRLRGEIIFRPGVEVGEVAAAAAGDEDFLADALGAFEHAHTPAPLPGTAAHISPAAPAPRTSTSSVSRGIRAREACR